MPLRRAPSIGSVGQSVLDADGYAIPETFQARNNGADTNVTGSAAIEDAFGDHVTSKETAVGADDADGYAIPQTFQAMNKRADTNVTGSAVSEDASGDQATSQETAVGADAAGKTEAVSPYVHVFCGHMF